MKKKFTVLMVLFFSLVAAASAKSTVSVALAAAKIGEWIPASNHPNIYHQVMNRSGGNEPEAVRFANQNSYRVKITVQFTYRPNKTNVGKRVVYLEGSNTYSEWIELGPNVEYSFSVDKD